LKAKLKQEWPSILQWMIDGCLAWQRHGMQPPQCVLDATHDYIMTEDTLGRWIDECCELDRTRWTPSAELFGSFNTWAQENNEMSRSTTKFGRDLAERGFKAAHRMTGNGFDGIKLKWKWGSKPSTTEPSDTAD
jgi:putative DNA primase/helicase